MTLTFLSAAERLLGPLVMLQEGASLLKQSVACPWDVGRSPVFCRQLQIGPGRPMLCHGSTGSPFEDDFRIQRAGGPPEVGPDSQRRAWIATVYQGPGLRLGSNHMTQRVDWLLVGDRLGWPSAII